MMCSLENPYFCLGIPSSYIVARVIFILALDWGTSNITSICTTSTSQTGIALDSHSHALNTCYMSDACDALVPIVNNVGAQAFVPSKWNSCFSTTGVDVDPATNSMLLIVKGTSSFVSVARGTYCCSWTS